MSEIKIPNENILERLDLIEKIVLEIGQELRAERDFMWFELGEMLDELKRLRRGE